MPIETYDADRIEGLQRLDHVSSTPGMRILAVSNLYPPYYIGGYELGAAHVMQTLAASGHHVSVLTSTYGVDACRIENGVNRSLPLHYPWHTPRNVWEAGRRELQSRRIFRNVLADIRPDVVLVWNMGGLSKVILEVLRTSRVPHLYAISDYWPLRPEPEQSYWEHYWQWPTGGVMRSAAKTILKAVVSAVVPTHVRIPAAVTSNNSFFTSAKLRQHHVTAGLHVEASPVIYWGIDRGKFSAETSRQRSEPADHVRVLFAGRLHPGKGPGTVLEALAALPDETARRVLLSFVGTGAPDYEASLRANAAALEHVGGVQFRGKLPPEEMGRIYGSHDIFVFPSIWEEPFSIALLEAMAGGLAIVGTTTGGSAEILEDGTNALTFTAGDAQDLARQLRRLIDDEALRTRLAHAASRTVAEQFDVRGMTAKVETLLRRAVASARRQPTDSRAAPPSL